MAHSRSLIVFQYFQCFFSDVKKARVFIPAPGGEGQQVRRRRPGVIYSTNQTFSYNFNILDVIIFPLHPGPKILLSVIFWIFCAYHP